MAESTRIMIAISGASGAAYARRLLEVLPQAYDTIYLTASDNAINIIRDELNIDHLSGLVQAVSQSAALDHSPFQLLDSQDMFAPPASGSHEYEGLVVVPCSMGVVGRIAAGISDDLVTRAADVCLKERRKVVLVIREAPLNLIHLRNLTALAEAGATVLPAAPAFYPKPASVGDLIDFVVDRVLRTLGTRIRLAKGWGA